MPVEPTPKDAVFRDGTATLYRFRSPEASGERPGVLLVPSMINRWYILDLREGASVAKAFVDAGFDTFLLDWGIPRDEDRYLRWDDVVRRLHRMVRRTKRVRGSDELGMLGYCMGATLCGIYLATHPGVVWGFANLAGPFDFSRSGLLGGMVNPEWFDADAISDAGNVAPPQMQSGFVAMRPTSQISKWVSLADRGADEAFRRGFDALDEWANDNIAFPAEAYRTYIRELYQENRLVRGEHWVGGRRAELGNIECPVLTITASNDHICPADAATALNEHVGSSDTEVIVIKGGHVGAVVGSRAARDAYPQITDWFASRAPRATETKKSENEGVTA